MRKGRKECKVLLHFVLKTQTYPFAVQAGLMIFSDISPLKHQTGLESQFAAS
jgi:hypothetical protein